jgi:hypothetical protein
MAIKITITDEEILNTSNNYVLGEMIRNKYWQARRDLEGIKFDDDKVLLHVNEDDKVLLHVNEDGIITSLGRLDSSKYDKCVICGKDSPYLETTHIDFRINYIEGFGQTCVDEKNCKKN